MSFVFNQTVTLESDPAFVGYVAGQCVNFGDGKVPHLLLTVVEPGFTGYHPLSVRPFPLADIQDATGRKVAPRKPRPMPVTGE